MSTAGGGPSAFQTSNAPAAGQTYIWSNINSSRLLNFSSNPQILTFKPVQRFKGTEGNIDGGCE